MKPNPWAISAPDAKAAEMQEFMVEAGGIVRMSFIDWVNTPSLLHAAENGDRIALELARVLHGALKATSSRRKPPLMCLTCDHAFKGKKDLPPAFIIWLPRGSNEYASRNTVACPICSACYAAKSRERLIDEAQVRWGVSGEG
jgi:hypothetical protein